MAETRETIITEEIKNKIYTINLGVKEEMCKFKKEMEAAKDGLNKMDELSKEMELMAKRIKQLKSDLNPLENNYKTRICNINNLIKDINDIEDELELNTFERMFRAINLNLPDDIRLKDDETNNISKNIMSGKNVLGKISIIGNNDINFTVQIEINDFIGTKQIDNTGEIYTIINFINEKMNYKGEKFTVTKKCNKIDDSEK